jgi:hypothetical protein
MRRIPLIALVFCLCAILPVTAQEAVPGLTAADRADLVAVLQEIARAGRRTEALEVAAALPALGADEEETKAAMSDAYRLAAGAKKTTYGALPGSGNKLRTIVKRLADVIRNVPEAKRTLAARALVRLDGTNADIRAWAGHTKAAYGWVTPEDVKGLERRTAFYAAAAAAANRPVKIYVGPSRLALARNMSGGNAYEYEHHGIHLHTTFAPEIAKAVLTEGVRGAWVLSTLMNDGTGVNTDGPKKREFNTVVVPTKPEYMTAVNLSASAGTLTGGGAANAEARQFYVDKRGFVVRLALMPKFVSSIIASRYLDPYFPPKDEPPGWFIVGIDQLVSLGYLKTPSGFYEQHGSIAAGSEESLRLPRGLKEARERINAGLAGSWSICAENVRAGTDLPLQECLHNDRALVIGEKLAKASLFAQFLYERGWLIATGRELIKAKGSTPAAWKTATGHEIEALDRLWRSWVTGNKADLVSLLAPPKAPKADRSAAAFLKALDQARKDALFDMRNTEQEKKLALDGRLNAGAKAHADVLNGGSATPLTPGAAWFANVLKGAKNAKTDIPRLMADPTARCALLDPGTRAIGWHKEGSLGVVQAAPAVGVTWNWRVVWPPNGSKDIPTTLPAADLPGLPADLTRGERGYPVSVHLHAGAAANSIKLLELQERDGDKVACDLITWTDPKWSSRLRPYTYVLVPKAPLDKKTLYDVTARAMDGSTTEWSFKTGR